MPNKIDISVQYIVKLLAGKVLVFTDVISQVQPCTTENHKNKNKGHDITKRLLQTIRLMSAKLKILINRDNNFSLIGVLTEVNSSF